MACQAAPATLKSAFLEPVGTQLAAELSVELVGRTDEDFMGLFMGAAWVGCGGVLVAWKHRRGFHGAVQGCGMSSYRQLW